MGIFQEIRPCVERKTM